MSTVRPTLAHGDVLTAISDGMVGLLKEFYGRGPTRTKSYYRTTSSSACCVAASRASSRRSSTAAAGTP